MAELGRFLEIASINNDSNTISIEEEILESLFESEDTEGCLVAVISVLGSPRSGKSKLLGKMLKYLHDENSIQVDENIVDRIATFGDDTNLNKRCIVTWSKPFFVKKGVNKRVAVYLLDIKGNFSSSNEKCYIMLSGLCACISSSIIYLHGDYIDEVGWKHLTNVTLEGLRYIGNKHLFIHQEIISVIQNWSKPEKYSFGDKESDRFCRDLKDHFKDSPRKKVFSAFEQFKFFLLPEENSARFTSVLNKLLRITLDSAYITTKRFGGEINTQDVSLYLQHHVEAVNYDEDYKGEFSDIKSLSEIKTTDQNILETPTISTTQANTAPSRSYWDMVNDLENNELADELNDEQITSHLPANEFSKSVEKQQEKMNMDSEMATFAPAVDMEGDINNSAPANNDLPKFTPVNKEEEFDYSEFMKQFMPQKPDDDSHLNTHPIPVSIPSAAEILKQININAAAKNASKSPKPQTTCIEPLLNTSRSTNLSNFSEQSRWTPDKLVHLESTLCTSQKEHSEFNDVPKMAISATLKEEREIIESMPPNIPITQQSLDKNAVRTYVSQVFQESQLNENKSANDILKQVSHILGPSQDNNYAIWEESRIVSQAIKAVMKYIEGMEHGFEHSLNFSNADFEKLHKNNSLLSIKDLDSTCYLKHEVEKKINSAKLEFQIHNQSVLEQKSRIIDFVVDKVKLAYEKEINCITQIPLKETKLKLIHENKKSKLLDSALKASQLDQSPLCPEIQYQVSMSLNKIFERILKNNSQERELLKKKIDLAASASKLYYENEMNRMVLSGVLNQVSQLENLHKTKLFEALRQFDQTPGIKEVGYLSTEARRCLETELLKCCKTIKNEFEERLRKLNSTVGSSSSNSSAGNKQIAMDYENYCEPSGEKSELGLGIHFEVSGATVALFQENKVEQFDTIENLVIGYDGQIVIGSGETAAGEHYINLRSLFEGNVDKKFKVKWNNTNYEFGMEECISMILSRWRYMYQKSFTCIIKTCVLAVPSFLSKIEVQAFHDAAHMSGFENINILRDISAAVVGHSFCSVAKDFPTKFIMINVLHEKWDAGLYDITENFKLKSISGDNFTASPSMFSFDKIKSRFEAFITDICKISNQNAGKTVFDVMLLSNVKNDHSENIIKLQSCLEVKNVRVIDKDFAANGCAFIAALMACDATAEMRWQEFHPNPSKCHHNLNYHWSTDVDHAWDEPLTSVPSKRKVNGINLRRDELLQLQQRLRKFVITKEEATEEANGILLSFSKKAQNGSMSDNACSALNQRISHAFTILRKDSTLVADIDQAIRDVQQYYEANFIVTPMEH